MNHRSAGLLGSAALVAASLAVLAMLWHQRNGLADLRVGIAAAQLRSLETTRLRTDNERMVAAQPGAAELERLRADREALRRLRAEIESLKQVAKMAAVEKPSDRKANPKPAPPPTTFAKGRPTPAGEWRNMGRASPAAIFETMLWAAASGDIDALAQSLTFDPKGRAAADRLWAQVSDTTRVQYATTERLLAALTAKDVPLGTAELLRHAVLHPGEMGDTSPGEKALVVARISDPEKKSKIVSLLAHRSGDEWRVLVPASAIQSYGNALTGEPNPSGGK